MHNKFSLRYEGIDYFTEILKFDSQGIFALSDVNKLIIAIYIIFNGIEYI